MSHNSPPQQKGSLPSRRTRAPIGNTNRKKPDEPQDQHTSTQSPSRVPKPYTPAEEHSSTVMQSTVSFMGKHDGKSTATKGAKGKAKPDKNPPKGAPLSNLEVMQCKFVETFESGKNNLRKGETYHNNSIEVAPTRFSSAPPSSDTSYLTSGEKGSPAYINEQQRLATTYHSTIHPYSGQKASTTVEIFKDENAQTKAQSKEREAGRYARIRENNARVEASATDYQSKLNNGQNGHIATVKKQQESYAQAIAVREARENHIFT